MTDQVVLITGTSNGIGKIMAQSLAHSGYRVIAAMRDVQGKNAASAAALRNLEVTHPVQVVEIDVTSDASVSQGVAQALSHAGRIDVLVNCAGIMWTGITEAFSTRQFQTVLDTNLVGPFRMLKAVLPHMRERQAGLCVTVTSLAGRTMAPGMGIYSASKAGAEALAEILGYEVASQNVDTVIVEPGPFQTNLINAGQAPEDQDVAQAYEAHFSPFAMVQGNVEKIVMEKGPEKTDPQVVADLVRDIIELPVGQRPLRVTAGLDFCAADLNAAVAPHQEKFLRLMGFGDEVRVKG